MCKAPPCGRMNAVVPLPPTTLPALLIPNAVWPAPVFNGLVLIAVPVKLAPVGAPATSTSVPTTCPVLLMPFTFDPTPSPVRMGSKLVNV